MIQAKEDVHDIEGVISTFPKWSSFGMLADGESEVGSMSPTQFIAFTLASGKPPMIHLGIIGCASQS
jgi:hypothetical protein